MVFTKKTILTILICGLMVLCITGCSNKNAFNIGNKSDIQISEQDVSLTIKEGTLKNIGATLVLTNNSDKNYEYEDSYKIEIKKDGEWHKINVELDFNSPLFSLKARKSKEIELDWENGYGKLTTGTYRIIKSINYEKEKVDYETFDVASEFTIE